MDNEQRLIDAIEMAARYTQNRYNDLLDRIGSVTTGDLGAMRALAHVIKRTSQKIVEISMEHRAYDNEC